jgi:hypothetical protein
MGPDNNWDLRYYHLYAPWAYLHGRYLHDIAPAQAQGFFNPTADLLFYGLISSPLNAAPRMIAFIMGALHGVAGAMSFVIAKYVLRPASSSERNLLTGFAVAIGVSGAGYVPLLGTTTNDLIHPTFVLGSLLALITLESAAVSRSAASFAAAGLLGGLGFGLKYTAIIFVPGLVCLALLQAVRHKLLRGLLLFLAALLGGFVLVAGGHLFTLWQAFRNPVFPLFNDLFQSPYFEAQSVRDTRFVAHDVGELLAYPFYWVRTNSYVVSELAFRDWRGAVAYLGALAVVAVSLMRGLSCATRRAETRAVHLVLIFLAVSYLCWAVGFGIYRYAIELELLTGVVIIAGLTQLLGPSPWRSVAAATVTLLVMTTTVYPDWGRGAHPSAGIRPAVYGDFYIDVRVPPLPAHSLVLIPGFDPVAYFIPFAQPTARYLGIENNLLELSQTNKLASEVKRLMRTPGPPKFVVSAGEYDRAKIARLVENFGLTLAQSPCRPIYSSLEEHTLSLCAVAEVGDAAPPKKALLGSDGRG